MNGFAVMSSLQSSRCLFLTGGDGIISVTCGFVGGTELLMFCGLLSSLSWEYGSLWILDFLFCWTSISLRGSPFGFSCGAFLLLCLCCGCSWEFPGFAGVVVVVEFFDVVADVAVVGVCAFELDG